MKQITIEMEDDVFKELFADINAKSFTESIHPEISLADKLVVFIAVAIDKGHKKFKLLPIERN